MLIHAVFLSTINLLGNLAADFLSEKKREEVIMMIKTLGCYRGEQWEEVREEELDNFR